MVAAVSTVGFGVSSLVDLGSSIGSTLLSPTTLLAPPRNDVLANAEAEETAALLKAHQILVAFLT